MFSNSLIWKIIKYFTTPIILLVVLVVSLPRLFGADPFGQAGDVAVLTIWLVLFPLMIITWFTKPAEKKQPQDAIPHRYPGFKFDRQVFISMMSRPVNLTISIGLMVANIAILTLAIIFDITWLNIIGIMFGTATVILPVSLMSKYWELGIGFTVPRTEHYTEEILQVYWLLIDDAEELQFPLQRPKKPQTFGTSYATPVRKHATPIRVQLVWNGQSYLLVDPATGRELPTMGDLPKTE